MSWARRGLLGLLLAVTIAPAGCGGDPPEKEMKDAAHAIDAARAAGAERYAHDSFAAAEESLKRAVDAVGERDYRQALNYALDSRERAQDAAKEAADNKAAVRADAERTLRDGASALEVARASLKAAEKAHVPLRLLADARRAIAAGESSVQEARTAFARGDYPAVSEGLGKDTAGLRAVARDLDAAAGRGERRRH